MRISLLAQPIGLHRALRVAQRQAGVSLERLSTGKRINRGADDPSGLVAAEHLKADRAGLESKLKGLERTSVFLGAKDGSLSVLGDLLLDLKGVVVSAANTGGLSEAERDALQAEADGIRTAIDHVSTTSIFNDQALLRGYHASGLGLGAETLNLLGGDLEAAQEAVDAALGRVNGERGRIGRRLKGLDAERNALMVEFENVSGAISLIEDTDVAAEVSNLVRNQILEEAAIYAIEIGRQNAESALKLLEGAVEMAKGA